MRPERLVSIVLGLALAPLGVRDVHAQAPAPRIEASVARDLRYGRGAGTPHHDAPGTAEVVIELHRADDLQRLLRLPGVDVARSARGPLAYGGFVSARIDAVGLAALRAAGFVDRVRTTPPSGIPPLDRSAERLGLPYVRTMTTEGVTGRGVLIADLDTPLDVFHPAYFRADAGYFDWIDDDGNGAFGAGDAIDVNHDGIAQPEERASVLSATPIDFGGAPTSALRPRGFDPGIDWIFFDLDGDGQRSVGMAGGYDDTAPGLGEPMFVPDDVDRDGRLDREERVVQLGSSKVRAARVDTSSGRTFEYARGTNLSEMLRDYTGGTHGYADTLHGSGVTGILVADVPLIGRRWVGIAPDADLVVASDFGSSNFDELMWLASQEPDVMVHEYVLWTTVALDGSDPTSMLIDSTTLEGVAHACPAGNIGGGGRHAMDTLAPGGVARFTVDVTTTYLEITVNVPVGTNPAVVLIDAAGGEHPFGVPVDTLPDGTELFRREAEGVRTHRALTFVTYSPAGLGFDAWAVEVRAEDVGEPYVVHAYVYDEAGFNGGSTLRNATDVSTLAWPSTADSCLAVGAYPSHTRDEGSWFSGREGEGEVRGYSARGPRLDGARTIGVVAPDNPWSPLGAGDVFPSSPGSFIAPEGAYQVFGGTSGAGPHVAGVLALLAQQGTHGADAIARILATTARDAVTGTTDNDDYGHGRLDAAAALGVERAGDAPSLSLMLSEDGDALRVSIVSTDPDGGAVTARWDLTYDGTWDTELGALDARSVALPAHLKVEVRDADGRRNQAVVRVDSLEELRGRADAGVPDAGPIEAGADAGPSTPSSGCGCRASRPTSGGWLAGGLLLGALVLARRR